MTWHRATQDALRIGEAYAELEGQPFRLFVDFHALLLEVIRRVV
jgi:hypothetical protein